VSGRLIGSRRGPCSSDIGFPVEIKRRDRRPGRRVDPRHHGNARIPPAIFNLRPRRHADPITARVGRTEHADPSKDAISLRCRAHVTPSRVRHRIRRMIGNGCHKHFQAPKISDGRKDGEGKSCERNRSSTVRDRFFPPPRPARISWKRGVGVVGRCIVVVSNCARPARPATRNGVRYERRAQLDDGLRPCLVPLAEATDVVISTTLIGRRLDSDLRGIANVPAITVFLRPRASIFSTLNQWRSSSLGVTSITAPGCGPCGSRAGGLMIWITTPGLCSSLRSIR
jgi:hypothetical protein